MCVWGGGSVRGAGGGALDWGASPTTLRALVPPPLPRRRYGFIIMDGNGSLFGTLSGNTREVLHKVRAHLRGGRREEGREGGGVGRCCTRCAWIKGVEGGREGWVWAPSAAPRARGVDPFHCARPRAPPASPLPHPALPPAVPCPPPPRGQVSVDLPKKHGRGGQSALRFARLRMEKRHNYVRKVSPRPAALPAPPSSRRSASTPPPQRQPASQPPHPPLVPTLSPHSSPPPSGCRAGCAVLHLQRPPQHCWAGAGWLCRLQDRVVSVRHVRPAPASGHPRGGGCVVR